MKLVLNSQNENLFNELTKISKDNKDNVEIIYAKSEKTLFDTISVGDVSAFIIENSTIYSQKAIDFIKNKHPYILTISIDNSNNINNADFYLPEIKDYNNFYSIITKNVNTFESKFNTLKKLNINSKTKIEFANCVYDSNLRILYHNNVKIESLSDKTGNVLEILALNYGNLIKKELILEKIWKKTDFFCSRSMDVYITQLRKIFKKHNINLKITNISKTGLILQ